MWILVNTHTDSIQREVAICSRCLLHCLPIFLDAQVTSQFLFPVVYEKAESFFSNRVSLDHNYGADDRIFWRQVFDGRFFSLSAPLSS